MGLDFLIIGVHCCGTTTLWDHMRKHPEVCEPLYKELNFFNIEGQYMHGQAYYESHVRMQHAGKHFEATVGYFEHLLVPFRIKKWYPNCKFIVLFRDPVRRAWSHYWQAPFKESEKKGYFDFIELTCGALQGHFQVGWLERGVYWYKLAHWWEVFSKEQILCVRSEDMFRKTQQTLETIQKFLGLESYTIDRFTKAASHARGKIPVEIEKSLQEYYKPYNAKLEKMTGINWNYD